MVKEVTKSKYCTLEIALPCIYIFARYSVQFMGKWILERPGKLVTVSSHKLQERVLKKIIENTTSYYKLLCCSSSRSSESVYFH